MKNLIALLLALTLVGGAYAQSILRNSLTTNDLSTNLVWTPGSKILNIRGNSPELDFWNTAGALNLKRYSISDSSGQFRFHWTDDAGGSSLLLGYFDSLGDLNVAGYLSLSGQSNRLTMANNQLLFDGVSVNAGNTTNTYNTIITTNLTVLNTINVTSNTAVTNINTTTINSETNIFNVAKGGHLTVSSNLTVLQVGPNKLVRTDSNTNLAAVTIGSGIAFDGTTLSSTVTGDTTGTNLVVLTQTGTNGSAMDFSLVQNGGAFKLVLTNSVYFGSPLNVVTTSFKKAWLLCYQPSTGTCFVQFTNGTAGFAWPERVSGVVDTNNGSTAIFEMITDLVTNGLVHISMTPWSATATNL